MNTNKLSVKSLLGALVLICTLIALFAVAPNASAQQYNATPLTLTTNGVQATAAANQSNVITLTKYDQLSLQIYAVATGANTGTTIAYFSESLDGTNYTSTLKHALAVTMNGTTPVTAVTNITVGSVGYLKLSYITNSGANPVTNIVIIPAVKPRKDG